MIDKSVQGQFLVPMAVSLAFGILFSTVITLFLIPSFYLITESWLDRWKAFWAWYLRKKPASADEEKVALG
jgi:Cu/Ag efflux pump CusA